MPVPPADDHHDAKVPELVELGRRVRSLRHEAGMTQEGLAHASGLHWTYVGQIERGERNPTYRNLLRLAAGLDVTASALLSGLGTPAA